MDIETIIFLLITYFALYTSIFWLLIYFENPTSKRDPMPKKFGKVSIIIPLYRGNDPETIKKAIESSINLNYPNKEVILAWNGPKNENYDVCLNYVKEGVVKLVSTNKIGKAAGLNEGIKHVTGEYFCCLDADSFYTKDALLYMVGYFEEDPKVAGVASSIRVTSPKNWVQGMTWVEFAFAAYLRKVTSVINGLYVMPGPGSMYRTSVIRELGDFRDDNLAEDMEMTFRMQSKGYRIAGTIGGIVDVHVPNTLFSLFRERLRWYGGFFQNFWMYKYMFLNPKYGQLGMFVLPVSIAWIFIAFYAIFKFFYNYFKNLLDGLKNLYFNGFDLQIFIKGVKESLFSFNFSFTHFFMFLLTIITLVVIYLGIKMINEQIDLRKRGVNYLMYFTIYALILSTFYVLAFIYFPLRKYDKWLVKWGASTKGEGLI